MRRDPIRRSGTTLLARWRGAAEVEALPNGDVPAPVSLPVLAPPSPPADEASAWARFDAEVSRSLATSAAESLRKLLAAPRAALASDPTSDNRENLLATLDLVEDFLDAVLLAGSRAPERP